MLCNRHPETRYSIGVSHPTGSSSHTQFLHQELILLPDTEQRFARVRGEALILEGILLQQASRERGRWSYSAAYR